MNVLARGWRVVLPFALSLGCGSASAPGDGGPHDGGAEAGPSLEVLAGMPGKRNTVDGTGMQARFSGAGAMVTDGAGNLYVSDYGRIRQIVTTTGVVTTLAGHPASVGVDGTGTDAAFTGVYGIVYDGQGNLFVTDLQTVRQVNIATTRVTTLAGTPGVYGTADGTGAAALFTELQGIALDGSGNLFVTDTYGRTIRQVVIATGAVTTLAGSGMIGTDDGVGSAATFYSPFGIAYDSGNLYVYDKGEIRQVEIATARVTTLVGSPTTGSADGVGAAAGLGSQGDVKSDGKGTLFIADTQNGAIRRLVLSTLTVTTIVGMLAQHTLMLGPLPGGLVTPQALAVDAAGAVYISDDFAILVAR